MMVGTIALTINDVLELTDHKLSIKPRVFRQTDDLINKLKQLIQETINGSTATVEIGGVRLIRKPYRISDVGSGPKGGRPKRTHKNNKRKEGGTIQ